jgi:hypothetical protein
METYIVQLAKYIRSANIRKLAKDHKDYGSAARKTYEGTPI